MTDVKLLMRGLLLFIPFLGGYRSGLLALRCLWVMSGKALDWDPTGLVGLL